MTKENMCYLCGNAFLIGKSSNAIKISKKKKNMFSLSHRIRMLFKKVIHIQFECNFLKITLNGGSLGSWVDEERSKLRVNL